MSGPDVIVSRVRKGDVGELFVEHIFDKYGIKLMRVSKDKALKLFGTIVFPDFLVEGKKILIEVKTDSSQLSYNQRRYFPKNR